MIDMSIREWIASAAMASATDSPLVYLAEELSYSHSLSSSVGDIELVDAPIFGTEPARQNPLGDFGIAYEMKRWPRVVSFRV